MKELCVVNFWDGAFDGDFFDFFFHACFGDITYTSNPHTADLIITSVFGNVQTNPKKTIAYIGENVRPNFIGYDHSLSFDRDIYGGRNFRLPLWYSRLAWDGFKQKPRKDNMHNHGYEQLIPIKQLTQSRKLDIKAKDKFCALIANNPEGLRINLYNSLSKYKQVDGYGNMFGKPLRKSKFAILPEYKFSLCPENSIYDGYVTEKLIDAYAGGTIPIYSGDISVEDEFNYDAFFNYQFFMSTHELKRQVISLDENIEMYQNMYEQPLFDEEPFLEDAIEFVRSIVK